MGLMVAWRARPTQAAERRHKRQARLEPVFHFVTMLKVGMQDQPRRGSQTVVINCLLNGKSVHAKSAASRLPTKLSMIYESVVDFSILASMAGN